MTQRDLKVSNAKIDPITGFMEFPADTVTGKSFNAQAKLNFLEMLEKTGNQANAMAAAGFSTRILSSHLKIDTSFSEAYRETLRKMEDNLVGTMYTNALTSKGTLDRFGWLRAHNPLKWAPKATVSVENDKEKLENLFKDAIDVEEVKE